MPMEGSGVWALLIAFAIPRGWDRIDAASRVAVASVVLVWLTAVGGLYGWMEWRRRAHVIQITSPRSGM